MYLELYVYQTLNRIKLIVRQNHNHYNHTKSPTVYRPNSTASWRKPRWSTPRALSSYPQTSTTCSSSAACPSHVASAARNSLSTIQACTSSTITNNQLSPYHRAAIAWPRCATWWRVDTASGWVFGSRNDMTDCVIEIVHYCYGPTPQSS